MMSRNPLDARNLDRFDAACAIGGMIVAVVLVILKIAA